ncbi:MAG: dTDP-4-dehydrorhamnose 3,5-epimerase [Planctomyces sp.]|nr:dTDP-4-dehydrorhamnose 3,5-epimerase [Planctomyces sp.]
MHVVPGRLPGLSIIEPTVFDDDRGWFQELFHAGRFAEAGLCSEFPQDNLSRSIQGVLRGLHYQFTRPQAKLVRVLQGRIFDVAVDLRRSSPTFGQWAGYELSDENRRALLIPAGFAHGFFVRSEVADVLYKCSAVYAPGDERTLRWNDPDVGVEWPLDGEPILSAKDREGAWLADADVYP